MKRTRRDSPEWGPYLRRLRRDAGVSQIELARRLCVPRQWVCAVEGGRKGSIEAALRIARALDRPIVVGLSWSGITVRRVPADVDQVAIA